MTPPRLWKLPVDFFARRTHYLDHLLPVWQALEVKARGRFYISAYMAEYAQEKGLESFCALRAAGDDPLQVAPEGFGPLVVAAYGDMMAAIRRIPQRPIIFMEHGIGLSFGRNPGYCGGRGSRKRIGLFLDPNEFVRERNRGAFPETPGVVVGTPKVDWTRNPTPGPSPNAARLERGGGETAHLESGKLVVGVGFHWNGSEIAPEAGTAYLHYREALGKLAQNEKFKVIGTGHPRYRFFLEGEYRAMGIEAVWEFEEVMRRADVYVNDCSSTMYEFLLTGRPVVILNAPWFRRKANLGIRFWEYTDIGPQVNEGRELEGVLEEIVSATPRNDKFIFARKKAARALYPHRGRAARKAARAIEEFTGRRIPQTRRVKTIGRESIGIIYMAFGERAAEGVMASVNSLHQIGLDIPVCVVGDTPIEGMQFVEWMGESPFDKSQAQNFQFRAGRVKPGLYALSPFKRTLYIDADTEFMSKKILEGWRYLDTHDLALAQELLSIGELYNKPRAGWEINIMERDATIKFCGGDKTAKFMNSGVLFFRKCPAASAVFEAWGEEWRHWQQWDEQLALMRALHRCKAKVRRLGVNWNHPHREQAKIIFHNYGRGVVRSNVT